MSDEYSSSLHRASAAYRDFDLPPPDTKRWVTRRKAVIVNAVRAGVISLEEVCRLWATVAGRSPGPSDAGAFPTGKIYENQADTHSASLACPSGNRMLHTTQT